MAHEIGSQAKDGFQTAGSVGFILGALLVLTGSALLPTVDLSNILEAQRRFGEQALRLQTCALLITFGYWAILLGTVSIQQAVTTAGGATWARLGFYFHLIGVVLWTLGMSLDVSYSAAIVAWTAAAEADKAMAYSVVTTLSPAGFGRGLFPMNVMVNWMAFALLSTGMFLSALYSRWLSGMGLTLGLAGMTLGVIMTFTGRESLMPFFVALWAGTILWWLMLGLWIARKQGFGRQMKRWHKAG